jgi:Peptidase family M28
MKAAPKIGNEKAYIKELIGRIIEKCPRRQATGDDEKRAQEMMAEEFERLGLDVNTETFRFNDSLYKNQALHFGLVVLATLISWRSPGLAFLLHALVGVSFYCDSARKGYILRRMFKFKESRNVLAKIPARGGEPKLRVVIAAHADASFTGFIFEPRFIKASSASHLPEPLKIFEQPMKLIAYAIYALAASDLLKFLFGVLAAPLFPIDALLSLPALIGLMIHISIIMRNEIVPGANDDLSAVAALPLLAERLKNDLPPEVELVLAVTGCEEASVGGADALAISRQGSWDRESTVFIALDCMAGGDLKYLEFEGDIVPIAIAPWIADVIGKVAGENEKYAEVAPYVIPLGGTDNVAFMAHGFEGVGLVCIDETCGAPRHYHLPSDTLENLDIDKVVFSIDFVEQLVREIARYKLNRAND